MSGDARADAAPIKRIGGRRAQRGRRALSQARLRAAAAAGAGESVRQRLENQIPCLLGVGGEIPVQLWNELKASVPANDRDGDMGQCGQILRQVAHPRPAAVLIVREIAHLVIAVLNVPVLPDQPAELLGIGPVSRQRGHRIGDLGGFLTGLDRFPVTLDAHDLAPARQVAAAAPDRIGDIHRPQRAAPPGIRSKPRVSPSD